MCVPMSTATVGVSGVGEGGTMIVGVVLQGYDPAVMLLGLVTLEDVLEGMS